MSTSKMFYLKYAFFYTYNIFFAWKYVQIN